MTAPAPAGLSGNEKAALCELDGVHAEEVAQAGVPAELPGTHAPDEAQAFSTKSPSLGPSDEMTRNAKLATEKEHQMSLWQGIKLYPKAVAWSMLISTCIVMEGESFLPWHDEGWCGPAMACTHLHANRGPRAGLAVCAWAGLQHTSTRHRGNRRRQSAAGCKWAQSLRIAAWRCAGNTLLAPCGPWSVPSRHGWWHAA